MKKNIGFIIVLCFISLFVSCKKISLQETMAEEQLAFINSFAFQNTDTSSDFYFKGLLDNQKIGYYNGVNNYKYAQFVQTSFDGGSSISTSNVPKNAVYARVFNIAHQFDSTQTLQISLYGSHSTNLSKADSILRKYLVTNEEFPLNKYLYFSPQDSMGFSLNFILWKQAGSAGSGGSTGEGVSTDNGNQTGSFIKITNVNKIVGFDTDIYLVTLSLKCKLYITTRDNVLRMFKSVDDGEMKIQIALPHL